MPYRLRSLILILCNSDFVEHGPWVADEKMVYPLLRELQPMGGPERIRFGDFEHLYLGSTPWTDAHLFFILFFKSIIVRLGVQTEPHVALRVRVHGCCAINMIMGSNYAAYAHLLHGSMHPKKPPQLSEHNLVISALE